MTDRDAQHYQAKKDDLDEWGEPQRRKPERRRLASMISVRFSPEEQDLVRREAKKRGTSVSNFVRSTTLQACGLGRSDVWSSAEQPKTVRDEWTAEGFQSGIVFSVAGQAGESSGTLTLESRRQMAP